MSLWKDSAFVLQSEPAFLGALKASLRLATAQKADLALPEQSQSDKIAVNNNHAVDQDLISEEFQKSNSIRGYSLYLIIFIQQTYFLG